MNTLPTYTANSEPWFLKNWPIIFLAITQLVSLGMFYQQVQDMKSENASVKEQSAQDKRELREELQSMRDEMNKNYGSLYDELFRMNMRATQPQK